MNGDKDGLSDEIHRELIIIRRGGGDENAAHKGGAWKIAYADFVTAMMAFFLVMWLINSANEATKARVASYFNPIKMTDAAPSGRGLVTTEVSKKNEKKEDDGKAEAGKGNSDKKPSDGSASAVKSKANSHEDAMLSDPFNALDKLAEEGSGEPSGRSVELVSQKRGDPFDPQVWELLRKGVDEDEIASALTEQKIDIAGTKKRPQGESDAPPIQEKSPAEQASVRTEKGKKADHAAKPDAKEANEEPLVVQELRAKITEFQKTLGGLKDLKFDIRLTDEGILIVLEDGKALSMFKIGSVEPNPALIAFIGEIGRLLQGQDGGVIIRGHTDARQFRDTRYDNWQLSTARAHMASYMLVRGGLSESRIRKIEGHGAADPLDRTDGNAAANRRVEFVLVQEK